MNSSQYSSKFKKKFQDSTQYSNTCSDIKNNFPQYNSEELCNNYLDIKAKNLKKNIKSARNTDYF